MRHVLNVDVLVRGVIKAIRLNKLGYRLWFSVRNYFCRVRISRLVSAAG